MDETSAPADVGEASFGVEVRDVDGVVVSSPSFRWRMQGRRRGAAVNAARLRVLRCTVSHTTAGAVVWDSGDRRARCGTSMRYDGPPLESLSCYVWQVRVADERGVWSAWSEPERFVTGLTDGREWRASWVAADTSTSDKKRPAVHYRTEFELDRRQVESAVLAVTARGLYTAFINGTPVSEDRLRPGFTSYRHRHQYQVYEVGDLLADGTNAIGVIVSDGWYRGAFGPVTQVNTYGEDNAVFAQMSIRGPAGQTTVASGDAWRWTDRGPLRSSSFNHGDDYDAREELPGWSSPGFDDAGWRPVEIVEGERAHLVAQRGPSVRAIEERTPVGWWPTEHGKVFDLGQNVAGVVRISTRGAAGARVVAKYSERLRRDGTVDLLPFAAARQRVRYTLRGEPGGETYEPTHLYQGFRYIEVEVDGDAVVDDVIAVVVHSDAARTGWFETSDRRLNRLQENIRWSQRANFVEIPTDCPHREKMGWTGDLQAYIATACFNMDVDGVVNRWLDDLTAEQSEDGRVPNVVPQLRPPTVLGVDMNGAAGWGDAATVVPWTLYRHSGDLDELARRYRSMRDWVTFCERRARAEPTSWRNAPNLTRRGRNAANPYIVNTGFHFGDWLSPSRPNPPANMVRSILRTPAVVATAFHANSIDLLRRSALALGHDADAAHLDALWSKTAEAFTEWFVGDDGVMLPDEQASYVVALAFGLVAGDTRQRCADRLAELVRDAGDHLQTGFLTTPHLCDALSANGHLDVAYRLLMQTTCPSWLYPVERGATSIWETWDGVRADGKMRRMSFNHYAFGAIGDWMYRTVAGLDQTADSVAFDHVLIDPRPGGGLSEARARYLSVKGPVESSWKLADDSMRLDVAIPVGARGTIRLRGIDLEGLHESGRTIDAADGVATGRIEDELIELDVVSGRYSFAAPLSRSAADRG